MCRLLSRLYRRLSIALFPSARGGKGDSSQPDPGDDVVNPWQEEDDLWWAVINRHPHNPRKWQLLRVVRFEGERCDVQEIQRRHCPTCYVISARTFAEYFSPAPEPKEDYPHAP